MNRILFTKKHIISSVGIALILILFIVGSWFLFISPQKIKLADSQKKISTLQNEIIGIETNLGKLKNNQIDPQILLSLNYVQNQIHCY